MELGSGWGSASATHRTTEPLRLEKTSKTPTLSPKATQRGFQQHPGVGIPLQKARVLWWISGHPMTASFPKNPRALCCRASPPCAAQRQPGHGRMDRDTWDLAGSGQCPCSHRQLLHPLQSPGVAAVIYVAAARRARAALGMLHGLHHSGFWAVPCPLSLLSGIRGQERKLFSQLITTTTL